MNKTVRSNRVSENAGNPAVRKASAGSSGVPGYIETGTPAFRRTNLAIFSAGFATYALLYCVQPLMPVFARQFHVSAAQSSLPVSLTTGSLAVSLLVAGSVSEAWGRKPLMVISLLVAAVLAMIAAVVPQWEELLLVRSVQGIAFSGLPAIAMAYLSEEMHPRALGLAMGLYIGGAGLGGMAGRLATGVLTDLMSWRFAIGSIGVFGMVAGLTLWWSLPSSLHFHPMPPDPHDLFASFAEHLRDPGLQLLFVEGFLVMGSFVTIYDYISYRLMAAPYDFSQSGVGAIFSIYLVGIASSAWVGHLAGRLGRRNVLWTMISCMVAGLILTLGGSLAAIVAGMAVFTIGFFGAHSILSSWIGLRARRAKAQASSLYYFFFYLGSSLIGWCGGFLWSAAHWPGVSAFVGAVLAVALLISLQLRQLQPRIPETAPGAVAVM